MGSILMKNQDMSPLETAAKKNQANTCFRMSGVHFQTNTAQEYVHTPQKFVVNMTRTKFDPLMSKGDGQTVQPQPL